MTSKSLRMTIDTGDPTCSTCARWEPYAHASRANVGTCSAITMSTGRLAAWLEVDGFGDADLDTAGTFGCNLHQPSPRTPENPA